MKIIQISDLHINKDFILSKNENIINKAMSNVNNATKHEESIVFICCGDIVDQASKDNYKTNAKHLFDLIKGKLRNKNIHFLFVPGNHDLCENSFEDFQSFISEYNSSLDFLNNNVLLYETDRVCFVLVNTTYHKDFRYGSIDIKKLEKIVNKSEKPIIIITHHTLLSRYEDDKSSIRNAYKFVELLEQKNIAGILHGHTHGYSNIVIGEKCRVIGVGSFFAHIKNCNNQFNIIDFQMDRIEKVTSYRYSEDLDEYTKIILYENKNRNLFTGNKISDIYSRIKETVKQTGGVNNLSLNISTDINIYMKDMEDNFSSDIETAKLWLKEEKPSTLYYNHGQYMIDSRNNGIDYIINELSRNSTSNRAIIPLIRLSDVLDKQFEHLPGLNSIQFGFTSDLKDELYCSVYLRSLEVNNFLKINLSEIYLLIMKICKEIRSVKKTTINLYAFKAQYKENFGCFKKAEIDSLSAGLLSRIVYDNDISKIIDILKDKFDMEETVVNTNGLITFCDILKESGLYESEIIRQLEAIIADLGCLKNEYMKSSNYDEIKPFEQKLHEKQKSYLELLSNHSKCQ